jgi:molecular chaperone DnaK (HSP70)
MLLGSLKARAEQALARPVTHAVIAGDDIDTAAIDTAATALGLTVLRLIPRAEAAAVAGGADRSAAAALGAAMLAEDLAARLSTVI